MSEMGSYNLLKGGTFYYPNADGKYPYFDYSGIGVDEETGNSYTEPSLLWKDSSNSRKIFNDRICKSPPGKYDTFPADQKHELILSGTEDDGDEIVHLDAVNDMLLVFKRNTLFIVQTSFVVGDEVIDKVISTNPGKGLDGGDSCQACRTGNGVAWINSTGVYHYDGNDIVSLSDGKVTDWIQNNPRAYATSTEYTPDFWQGRYRDFSYDSDTDYFDTYTTNNFFIRKLWMFAEDFQKSNETNIDKSVTDFAQFHGNVTKSIGWDPQSNKLICLKNIGSVPIHADGVKYNHFDIAAARDALIYTFYDETWCLSADATPSEPSTNFVNFKNKLMFYSFYHGDPNFRRSSFTGGWPSDSKR